MKTQSFPPALLLAALIASTFITGFSQESPRPFLHPDRIRYDSHCLTIDGKDVLIYSGAFHYFRCPKPLWKDRFQKIKDAGFNAVETYTAWNWHEQQMPGGPDDFSKVDLKDFDDWLKMAESFGLYIIVRPGPYICAEWDTGGFPQWLLAKKPGDVEGETWLRSDDPEFLVWCKHWYDAVCPVIARHQITRKAPGSPGVILVQLENEYDYAHFSDEVKIHLLKSLAADARADGIEVPFMTCWAKQVRGSTDPVLRGVFDSCNFYPRWNVSGELGREIPKLRREQPDAPLMTTELQGGWFSQVGGKLSEDQDGVDAPQIQNITLYALQEGDTIMNYYMLFGGSNFGDRGARGVTTTYDYAAPIRECGGVDARYERVWALGHMLREHGTRLARAETVECEVTTAQKDVTVAMRRAQDGSRYLFVRTSEHTVPRQGTAHVTAKSGGESQEIAFDYDLEPFGSKVLYLPPGVNDVSKGEWLPKPAPAIERPADLPGSVVITTARHQEDPGPVRWKTMKSGDDLAHLGIYDSEFLYYKAAMNLATPTNLLAQHPHGDAVLAAVNGKASASIGGTAGGTLFTLGGGSNDVMLLYENEGHPNIGAGMETRCGVSSIRLTAARVNQKAIGGWRMREVNGTKHRPEVAPDFDDADWTTVSVDKLEPTSLPPNHDAVYRARVVVNDADLQGVSLDLIFGRVDDRGWVFVNGKQVGTANDWSQEQSFNVTKHLKAGTNVIAVVVHNNDGQGGIGLPSLGPEPLGGALAGFNYGRPSGLDNNWYQRDFADKHWQTVAIGEIPSSGNGLLEWYRMEFKLPKTRRGVWVPWRLHINATGNGFLYLNGHALGRYFASGPQYDFFLPECWLKSGRNVIAMSLRPLDRPAVIQAAVVEPYAKFAEKR